MSRPAWAKARLNHDRPGLPQPVRLAELMREVTDELAAASGDRAFVRTGFDDLDELTRGVRAGELWAVTGRSGVGKSVLATDLVRSCAVAQRRRALYVSRRERGAEVARRILCAEASVPWHQAQMGPMPAAGFARLGRVAADLADAPLEVLHAAALDPTALAAYLDDDARAHPSGPVQLVVIDDVPAGPSLGPTLAVLQDLAGSRRVATVAVVREDVGDPQRQRRRVEQVADVTLHLHRDDQDNPQSDRAGEADLIVQRNRRGPVTRVALAFQGHYGRFVDLRQ